MTSTALIDTWRAMTPDDIDRVVTLERLAYSHPWTAGNFADSLAAGYPACTAWRGDDLLGYCLAMRVPDEWHVLNLCVHPGWQGRGIGRGLLTWAETGAQADGAQSILLEVRASNERARRIYEQAGFFRIGLRRGYYPSHQGREDAIVMRLSLAGGHTE